MPLQTAFQRKYKSGGCLEYDKRFGAQQDPRAFKRLSFSLMDMLTMSKADRQLKEEEYDRMRRKAIRESKAKAANVVELRKELGFMQRQLKKLKDLKDKMLGGFQR